MVRATSWIHFSVLYILLMVQLFLDTWVCLTHLSFLVCDEGSGHLLNVDVLLLSAAFLLKIALPTLATSADLRSIKLTSTHFRRSACPSKRSSSFFGFFTILSLFFLLLNAFSIGYYSCWFNLHLSVHLLPFQLRLGERFQLVEVKVLKLKILTFLACLSLVSLLGSIFLKAANVSGF